MQRLIPSQNTKVQRLQRYATLHATLPSQTQYKMIINFSKKLPKHINRKFQRTDCLLIIC